MIQKNGRPLTTLEEWRSHAKPKNGSQWKDGHSAKENARPWLDALPDLPTGIAELLRASGSAGTLRSWSAEPEAKVRIDEFRGPPNPDILAHAEDRDGPIVFGVEAKADEPFSRTLKSELAEAQDVLAKNPNSGKVERIRRLATAFGLDPDRQEVLGLRHQLLTLTAATVEEARRKSAERAMMIVQEFVPRAATAGKRSPNARDLDRFLGTVFGHSGSLGPGMVAGPFRMEGIRELHFGRTAAVMHGRVVKKHVPGGRR